MPSARQINLDPPINRSLFQQALAKEADFISGMARDGKQATLPAIELENLQTIVRDQKTDLKQLSDRNYELVNHIHSVYTTCPIKLARIFTTCYDKKRFTIPDELTNPPEAVVINPPNLNIPRGANYPTDNDISNIQKLVNLIAFKSIPAATKTQLNTLIANILPDLPAGSPYLDNPLSHLVHTELECLSKLHTNGKPSPTNLRHNFCMKVIQSGLKLAERIDFVGFHHSKSKLSSIYHYL